MERAKVNLRSIDGGALATAEEWIEAGRQVALATVIETWGSAPRPVGSHLVIDDKGNFEGSVSGGCVEGAVVGEAIDVLGNGKAKVLEFGVADETAWRVGLSCGGRIKVYVERVGAGSPIDLAALKRLNAARTERRAALTVTDLSSGDVRLVVEGDGRTSRDPLGPAVAERLQSGVSGTVADPSGRNLFVAAHFPPPRLVAIGAVHISQALAPMAQLANFDVTIIDPRTAFATPERFGQVKLIPEWPDVALPRVGLDPFTALAALTHDPKIDDGAIAAALRAGCFYVGALGSRKTHGKRLDRLKKLGLSDADLGRIRAPIGMEIGAQSPAEIAVAILAEVIRAHAERREMVAEAAA
jgi:xanthine dehydrogenase accessory factor